MEPLAHKDVLTPLLSLSMAHHDSVLVQEALAASRPVVARTKKPRFTPQKSLPKAQDIMSRAPAGRHFPDNPKPSDHILFLHGGEGSANRWVCLRRLQPVKEQINVKGARNLPSMKVRLPTLLEYIDELTEEPNLYLAQADFIWGAKNDKHRHRAQSQYLNSIGVEFVDLDVYNSPRWEGVPMEDVARQMRETCVKAGVPEPVIIGSGRGLYANWKLTERIDLRRPQEQERWGKVQRKMMALLQDFEPDPKVRDATRILRLVGSINPRSGTRAAVLHDDGRSYSLGALEHHTQALSDDLFAPKKPAKKTKATHSRPKACHSGPIPTHSRPKASYSDEPLSTPAALAELQRMLHEAEALVPALGRTRRYQYRLFKDIAQVVIERGGIAHGSRDEFVFWLLVMRFNAGLYGPDELQGLAARFSGLTQGGLNLWDEGMLSTLHVKMSEQVQSHGHPVVVDPIIRKEGAAFTAVRQFQRNDAPNGVKNRPLGHGSVYTRPMVYTPKASTLIERLGITEEEQTRLDCLISPQERKRRDRANSATARRELRNKRVLVQVLTENQTVEAVARDNQISLATAYRILANEPTVAQRVQSRREALTDKRSLVLRLHAANSEMTMRSLAAQAGVSVSTAHRWVNTSRQRLAQSQAKAQTQRANQTIQRVALRRKPFKRQAITPSVSTKTSTSLSINTAVPHSQSSAYSNKGYTYGRDIASYDDIAVTNNFTQSSVDKSLRPRRSSRFDFVRFAKRNQHKATVETALTEVVEAESKADTLTELRVDQYWDVFQDQALLNMPIPEVPGMEDNIDFMLDVMTLYGTTKQAAVANGLCDQETKALVLGLELMLMHIHELAGPDHLEQAMDMVETQLGCDMMQEAYESLIDVIDKHGVVLE